MLGLIKKDVYIIIKNFKPMQLFILIPSIFAATQNPGFLMAIICIMVAMILGSQISQTFNSDESEKWYKILSGLPVSSTGEAGSRYVLLIATASLSGIIVLLIGLVVGSKGIITNQFIIIYASLSLFYTIMYGVIVIPAAYKFGVYNTRYILMIFIFIPSITPVILNSFNIDITYFLNFLTTLNKNVIVLSVIVLTIIIVTTSFILTKAIISKRQAA